MAIAAEILPPGLLRYIMPPPPNLNASFFSLAALWRTPSISALSWPTIDSSTVGQLNALIEGVRQRAAREKKDAFKLGGGGMMYLNSPGGSISAAMAIGRILRKHRIRVWVRQEE